MSKADGQKIAIKFNIADITSDISACAASAFAVIGKEYNMEPGGALIDEDYEIDTVEAHPEYIRYTEAFGGIKTNTVLDDDGALCLTSSGGSAGYGIVSYGARSTIAMSYEVGMRFTVGSSDITVSGLRIMAPSARTANAHLWRISDQTLLGNVSITATAGVWSEGIFTAPITLSAGASYVVSYYATPSWYCNTLSSNTFNSSITVIGSSGNSIANAFPTPDGTTQIYGLVDIVIAASTAYSLNGTYESGLIDVSELTGDLKIKGTVTTPAGTAVTLQYATGATRGAWQTIELDGTFTPDTNVWLKATLATSDTSATPTIGSLYLQDTAAPSNIILLTLDPLKRFHRVNGDLTISYNAAIGNLAGSGGAVASFSRTFTPADLVNKPNPNDMEHVEMSVAAAGALTSIYYTDVKEEEHIELTVSAAGTLTHVDNL